MPGDNYELRRAAFLLEHQTERRLLRYCYRSQCSIFTAGPLGGFWIAIAGRRFSTQCRRMVWKRNWPSSNTARGAVTTMGQFITTDRYRCPTRSSWLKHRQEKRGKRVTVTTILASPIGTDKLPFAYLGRYKEDLFPGTPESLCSFNLHRSCPMTFLSHLTWPSAH